MSYAQKLAELREVMASKGLDGFVVPRTDEYLGEYVPKCAERLEWLTGFTGSAGLAVIMADKAMVMSDGRYTIQLAAQVDQDLFELENSQIVKPEEWLKDNTNEAAVIGYDPKLHTPAQIEAKEQAGLIMKAVAINLIDKIWKDQPAAPCEKVSLFPENFAGQSAADKITDIQNKIKEQGADAVVLTMSDSIAWLLNIRGGDIPFIPVTLSYLILPATGKAQWFVHPDKIDEVQGDLNVLVDFREESTLRTALEELKGSKVLLDPKRSSIWFKNTLEASDVEIIAHSDPCIAPRACKNEIEQAAMKQAHVRDGVAMVKFLKWFSEANNTQTEMSVEEKLQKFRAEAPEFKEPSFSTIAGFGANGAIVHYRADEKSNKQIEQGNLLLLDSGAQYEDGTTDITRTIAVGEPSAEMRIVNTLVLKGHIALASAEFKHGTLGKELDHLARAPLQEKGLDYSHGTGHGVGCYLSVHEEAAMGITPRAEAEIEAGMIISNEPGYYKEGEYGIRIENLILAKELDDKKLCFETITLAPIDQNLIEVDMLSIDEKDWLNNYHQRVFEVLSPLLDNSTSDWLKTVTKKI